MKTISTTLINYLNAFRPTSDMPLLMADCFTLTLAGGSAVGIASGTVLTYTDLDVPILLNGLTYAANSLQVSGLKYKCSVGVNVDEQDITLSAWPWMTIGSTTSTTSDVYADPDVFAPDDVFSPQSVSTGIPIMQAIQNGLLDGAEIQRERVFFETPLPVGTAPLTPIGGSIILFKGRVTSIDKVGRTSAQVKIASDLTLLDIQMPRNLYQPNCVHTLYDSGCGVSRSAHTSTGAVGAGSTLTQINWTGATSKFQQGAITFTSGANSGLAATIKTATTGALTLAYPLQHTPGVGDTFTASWGCPHTQGACKNQFNNLPNFRGFPYVPPPQIITGPLSYTYTPGSK